MASIGRLLLAGILAVGGNSLVMTLVFGLRSNPVPETGCTLYADKIRFEKIQILSSVTCSRFDVYR